MGPKNHFDKDTDNDRTPPCIQMAGVKERRQQGGGGGGGGAGGGQAALAVEMAIEHQAAAAMADTGESRR